jgi:hypothetical protein
MIDLDALSIRKRDGGSEEQVLRNGRELRDALADFLNCGALGLMGSIRAGAPCGWTGMNTCAQGAAVEPQ